MLADGGFSRASIAENRNVTLPGRAIIGRVLNRGCCGEDREMITTFRALFVGVAAIGLLGDRPSGARARQNHQDRRAVSDVRAGLLFRRAGQARRRTRARAAQQGGVNGYKFEVQYEDSSLQPAARDAGRQAPDRAIQARRHHRRGMLGRDARHHADHRAGQGAAAQRRLVVASRSPSRATRGRSASCRTK